MVDLVSSEKTHRFLGRVDIAIDLLGIDLYANVHGEGLHLLMDGLVAFTVGFLHSPEYLWAFHNSVVDVQQ